jgi:hypothetical protein
MSSLIFTLLGFGLFGLLCFIAYHAGASDEKAKGYRDDNEAVQKALAARERLRRDAAYAARLRRRFSR